MNPGIIICTRLTSKRVPSKAIIPINEQPALFWLLKRLEVLKIPVILAVPYGELPEYINIFQNTFKSITFFSGSERNVLERMYEAANHSKIDPIIRVTHDDLLIDTFLLKNMLKKYEEDDLEYMCCSKAIEGTASEIISFARIKSAYENHSNMNIEHISYFVKNSNSKCLDYPPHDFLNKPYRLTLDYPKDLLLLEVLSRFVDFHSNEEIISFLDKNQFLLEINELPKITIFITCFNGSRYLQYAIDSIRKQTFKNIEFYFVDDGSTDDSLKIAAKHPEIKIIVNSKNKGIAHSSNRVLEKAKGKYIIRLDSDDVLLPTSLQELYDKLENNPSWSICYSGYFETDDKLNIISEKSKNVDHHIAGSLISKKALNELKFKEGLKHYDSQELYSRMTKSFDYGYIEKPLFLYRQHKLSWSHTAKNLKERNKVKVELNL